MQPEYRIKEVKVGFSHDNISTYFYPQVLESRKIYPNWMFWKKVKKAERWNILYQLPEKKIQTMLEGETLLIAQASNHIIACETLKMAQAWIQEYKEQEAEKLANIREKVKKYAGSAISPNVIHPAEY